MTWTDKEYKVGNKLTIRTENNKVYNFEEVEEFRYLGTVFSRRPDIKREIQARLMAGNRCVHAMRRLLKNKDMTQSLKIRIYKSMIRPIVMYASETWVLRKEEQDRLRVWERKILRNIYGGKEVNGMWERRTNNEIKELYKEPDIIGVIKAQRIRWLGHITRMHSERVPARIINCKIGNTRRQGRPRVRWKKEVEDDMRQMGVQGWREKALDRQEWKKVVNQAMGLLGL
ncbi:uncharacterized protein LOC108914683 [Anoplophora glabripennis]|uniref:uncharacterized protein LOC108914683 n=1 Tax=Anoplophora glabripennis TaxID=217634 RepID=UPI000875235A|nr:uncharacterized protein LOC108914683 [Anoplophora glabripennis]